MDLGACINPAMSKREHVHVATINNEFHAHLVTRNIDIPDAVSYE